MPKYNIKELELFVTRKAVPFWNLAHEIFGYDIGGKMPELIINTRLTSTAGRAFLRDNYCDFSAYLLTNSPDYFAVDIIPHELSHHIAYRLFGDSGHGKAWKHCSMLLYGRCNTYHTMETLYQAKQKIVLQS